MAEERASGRGGLRALLEDEGRFWPAFATLCGVVALLKGLRLPNLWAATQAQFDYSDGFIRRGLFGEILGLLHVHHYVPFAVFSYGVLLGLCLLLWRYAWRERSAAGLRGAAVTVFFSSFALSYLADLAGYLDIALALLTVGFLLTPNVRARMVLAPLVVVGGILIHEVFAIVFFPVVWLRLLLDVPAGQEAPERKRRMIYAGALLVFAVVTTGVVALAPAVPRGGAALLEQHVAQRVDFPVRQDVFAVLHRSARVNLAIMVTYFYPRGRYWFRQLQAALVFWPSAGFFLWLALRGLERGVAAARRKFLEPWVLTAALAPLLMNLVGWDVFRWGALMVLTAFLTLLMVEQAVGGAAVWPTGVAWQRAAMVLIALNLASGVGFLDGYRTGTLPFPELTHAWSLFLQTHHLVLPAH